MVFERMGKDVLSPYERSIAMLPDGRLAVVSDERMEEFDGVKSEKIRGKAGIIKLPDITVFIIFI